MSHFQRFAFILITCVHMYLYGVCTHVYRSLWRLESGIGYPGAEISGDYKPLCGFQEPELSFLQQQQALFAVQPSPKLFSSFESMIISDYSICTKLCMLHHGPAQALLLLTEPYLYQIYLCLILFFIKHNTWEERSFVVLVNFRDFLKFMGCLLP